jgi:hypothetical protein
VGADHLLDQIRPHGLISGGVQLIEFNENEERTFKYQLNWVKNVQKGETL